MVLYLPGNAEYSQVTQSAEKELLPRRAAGWTRWLPTG
jgi:hypothetical protein